MINAILTAVLGSKNDREMKRLRPLVEAISALEPRIAALPDAAMRGRAAELREGAIRALADAVSRGRTAEEAEPEILREILVETFALAREAARRALGMRPFDVQIIGGIILHEGKIAEMKTGEGKTLVATLPATLNALTGRGVHVVTVNDYLARRDAEWMGEVYRFLGLRVGCVQNQMGDRERQEAYGSDITYGTNSEFGFDYLRDNMKYSLHDYVQREHHMAVVDEVDSILIDEARTPLIISGPSEESTEKYYVCDAVIPRLTEGEHFEIDEKARTAVLTEAGVEKAEKTLGIENLYEPENVDVLHGIEQALRAHSLYRRDRDYMVRDGQVLIVDEFTGRVLPGRRWSDGLHQAVEAKEKVKIEKENQTLATITYQNYFRMYDKLAGMTGTAETEEAEFGKIYDLDVVVIPTNRPLRRVEHPDLVYRTSGEKYDAIVEAIVEMHESGQPVLMGTASIERSEHLSTLLKRRGVPHVVLNAKYHEKEAEIVAQAGRKGKITIATNMAGRGTDIVLGGNAESLARLQAAGATDTEVYREALGRFREECAREHDEVVSLGGLHILGTERHEARRIDNQLRGRAGRQGDPGSSRFFLSLEDDLMRIFARDWVSKFLQKLGMEEGVPIEHGMVTRAIERAQKQVEQHNFDIRKHLLEYDDVMNKQRVEIYSLRRELLAGAEQKDYVLRVAEEIFEETVDRHLPENAAPSDWTTDELLRDIHATYGIGYSRGQIDFATWNRAQIKERIHADVMARYREKEERLGSANMRQFERLVLLRVIDTQWKDHLLALDHLKEGIGLRGYGQRDPLVEYKRESFELFGGMKARIEEEVVRRLFLMEPILRSEEQYVEKQRRRVAAYDAVGGGKPAAPKTVVSRGEKVGRNDPCPCGSGKKYKKCCGAGAMV